MKLEIDEKFFIKIIDAVFIKGEQTGLNTTGTFCPSCGSMQGRYGDSLGMVSSGKFKDYEEYSRTRKELFTYVLKMKCAKCTAEFEYLSLEKEIEQWK